MEREPYKSTEFVQIMSSSMSKVSTCNAFYPSSLTELPRLNLVHSGNISQSMIAKLKTCLLLLQFSKLTRVPRSLEPKFLKSQFFLLTRSKDLGLICTEAFTTTTGKTFLAVSRLLLKMHLMISKDFKISSTPKLISK